MDRSFCIFGLPRCPSVSDRVDCPLQSSVVSRQKFFGSCPSECPGDLLSCKCLQAVSVVDGFHHNQRWQFLPRSSGTEAAEYPDEILLVGIGVMRQRMAFSRSTITGALKVLTGNLTRTDHLHAHIIILNVLIHTVGRVRAFGQWRSGQNDVFVPLCCRWGQL